MLPLRWVQKHIAALEEIQNASRCLDKAQAECLSIVISSEMSSCPHLQILQFGLIRMCGVMSVDEYQICYEKMLTEIGMPLELSPGKRVEKLLAINTTRVATSMVPVFVTPVITMALCDGVLIHSSIPSAQQCHEFKIPSWCPEIMMGDARSECIIWNKVWDNLSDIRMLATDDLSTPTAERLLAKMNSYLVTEQRKGIAEIYGITTDLSSKETFDVMERFTS